MGARLKEVVVTGMGVVSSLGIGRETFWDNLISGVSGISEISSFDTMNSPYKFGGEVKVVAFNDRVKRLNISKYGKASQFAIIATKLALVDGKLLPDLDAAARFAGDVIVGTTMGEIQALEEADRVWLSENEESVDPGLIFKYPSHSIAINVAKEIRGTCRAITVPTACAAGNYAIGYGYDLIRTGRSQWVVAGGAEAFSRIAYTGFSRMFAMAKSKCSPFSKGREGMLLGEGAAFLLLESAESARSRKVSPYARVAGYGLSCDASHMTIPSERGVKSVMMRALAFSDIDPSEVDYISAHGTGTQANDKVESAAINAALGSHAKDVPVSSIKSMLGHTMGAASAMEAISCVLTIVEGKIPPTINYSGADPECKIDCVPNKSRSKKVRVALNNSFAFGGNNSCSVFSKFFND